jgi:cell wall-associated NlpC family hydrolase
MGKRVPISSAQPGDLLFFAVKGNVHHVGLVVKNENNQLWMIHSATSRGVVLEEVFTSGYWGRRLLCARDLVSQMALSSEEDKVSLDSF